jgi:hypothetical protein
VKFIDETDITEEELIEKASQWEKKNNAKKKGQPIYFVDKDGKSKEVNEESWKLKGTPFHAIIEWNFPGCKETLMIDCSGIKFCGPNESKIHILCDSLYKNGYLVYNNLDEIIDDLLLLDDGIMKAHLLNETEQLKSDLKNGIWDKELERIEEKYKKDKIAFQGPQGFIGVSSIEDKIKKEAKDMVDSFVPYAYATLSDCNGFEANGTQYKKEKRRNAKQCALLCVKKLIQESDPMDYDFGMPQKEYWQKVKQEIETNN